MRDFLFSIISHLFIFAHIISNLIYLGKNNKR
nr:MAG TPA: hypothetical protein [Caudoviricetes sp.]